MQQELLTCVLVGGLCLIPASRVTAQAFTNLHSFSATDSFNGYTNSDGAQPYDRLVVSGNTLYGTASAGGAEGGGTVFAMNTDGSGFTNTYTFPLGVFFDYPNGALPAGGLILSGSTLYGTTGTGGASGWGTVFAVNTDGTGVTNLHSFVGSDGSVRGSLILSSNTLYGTAEGNGFQNPGNVFAVSTGGGGFTNVHKFTALDNFGNNADGGNPNRSLVLSGDTLYGTTHTGGTNGYGTVFAVNTNGTGFTTLHTFAALDGFGNNTEGASPYCGLTLSGNALYGTTFYGGTNGYGTIFAINTDGSGFTNLHNCTVGDGQIQYGGLIVSSNKLYGATVDGGTWGEGTVFAVNTNGASFKNLYNFTQAVATTNRDGAVPFDSLILSNNVLYGTARDGGTGGEGTVFALDLSDPPPPIQFTASPTNGTVSLIVQFNSPSVDANGNPIISWNWDFGDSSTSTNQNPSYTYTSTGSFSPTLVATNNYGDTVSATGPSISVASAQGGGQDLGTALNATNLTWTTGGDTNWFSETTTTYDGVSAAQSGPITDSQTSYLETTIPSDGQISLYWKVSSQQYADYLIFYINGVEQDAISGEVDWNHETYPVSAGDTLRWEYSKDASVSAGADAGWLDQVQYSPPAYPATVNFSLSIQRYQDLTYGYTSYYASPQINYVDPAPITTNRVESPYGVMYSEVLPGDSYSYNSYGQSFNTLDDLIAACTNGQWTLYINKGDPSEQVFHFNVSISGLTTNLLAPITVTSPIPNSANVVTNTPFEWSGPAGFSSIFVEIYAHNPVFTLTAYANLAGDATNWPSPPTLPYGTNYFYVAYDYYNPVNVTFTMPLKDDSTPLSSWFAAADLQSAIDLSFYVGAPEPLPFQLTVSPRLSSAGEIQFSFGTLAGRPLTIQVSTNLPAGVWTDVTNFVGDGSLQHFAFPATNLPAEFFRVRMQ